jgi:hypothetical protein
MTNPVAATGIESPASTPIATQTHAADQVAEQPDASHVADAHSPEETKQHESSAPPHATVAPHSSTPAVAPPTTTSPNFPPSMHILDELQQSCLEEFQRAVKSHLDAVSSNDIALRHRCTNCNDTHAEMLCRVLSIAALGW